MIYKNGKPVGVEPLRIDKNVPIPPALNDLSSPIYAAARLMEVGDSIALPWTRDQPVTSNMRRATGWKFSQRTVIENGEKLLRIWRIE